MTSVEKKRQVCLFSHLRIGKKLRCCLCLFVQNSKNKVIVTQVCMCVRAHVRCERADSQEALPHASLWAVLPPASHRQQHELALGEMALMLSASTSNVEVDGAG